MTIREYISQKYASFGLILNEADLLDMGFTNAETEISESNINDVKIGFVSAIPSMLARPQSISEGGVSISRAQKEDIEAFYKSECKKLGLYDRLTPRVRFL